MNPSTEINALGRTPHSPAQSRQHLRRGVIMILTALLLPVLVLIVGFSVDFAHMQRVRTELRRSADLSAKAAATVLSETADVAQARQTAKDVALLNKVNGTGLTLTDSQIIFGSSQRQPNGTWNFTVGGANPNAVQVIGRRTASSPDGAVNTYFGAMYGQTIFEPQFSATGAFVNSDIVLVLDRSSSMKLPTTSPDPLMSGGDSRFCDRPRPDCRWVALESAIDIFLAELDSTSSQERVAVVTFASDFVDCSTTSNKTAVDCPMVTDTNTIRNTMNSKSNELWNGMTDIAAGIIAGQDVLLGPGSRANAQKFMIVLTDGQYTEDNPLVAGQAAANAGIVIYTVTFSLGANQSDMQQLATIGNGRHYHADNPVELNSAFQDLGGSIANLVR